MKSLKAPSDISGLTSATDVFFALGVFNAERANADRLAGLDSDWNGAADLSFRLKTPLILFHNLSRFGLLDRVTLERRKRWEAWRDKALKLNLYWTHRFLEISGWLRDEGIRAVPLKGLSLANGTYLSEALRASSDLDIWIAPKDARRAAEILKRKGCHIKAPTIRGVFVNHGQEFSALSPEGADVDVHFRLFSWYAERIVFGFDSSDFFSRVVETEWNGSKLWRMSFEDEFHYALMSYLGSGQRSFRYVLDADALLRTHRHAWDDAALKARLASGPLATDFAKILAFLRDRLRNPHACGLLGAADAGASDVERRLFAFRPEPDARTGQRLLFGFVRSFFDKIRLVVLFARWQAFKRFGWHRSFFLRHNNPEDIPWEAI